MNWKRKTSKPKFPDDVLRVVVTMAQERNQLSEISKATGIPIVSIENKLRLQGINLTGLREHAKKKAA